MTDHQPYGFQGRLSPDFPSQIVVDVTEYCNLACMHCPHEAFSNSPAFGGRHLSEELNKKLVDEVAVDGKDICQYLRYTGGEPLIHPEIVDLLSYAKKHGGAAINLTTNGMLLDDDMAGALLDAGVDVFDISIDAFSEETYQTVRRKGDLTVSRPNVLNLIHRAKKGGYQSKVTISFIEQSANKGEADDFERFWKESGADYVVVRRLHTCAGNSTLEDEMMFRSHGERRPCLYPWERLVVGASGKIGYCPADWMGDAKISHLSEVTLKEVWQGEKMEALRQAHLANDYSKHSFCGQCADWEATRWPFEGRSYANMMEEFSTDKAK